MAETSAIPQKLSEAHFISSHPSRISKNIGEINKNLDFYLPKTINPRAKKHPTQGF
jgi:hypothetical protein